MLSVATLGFSMHVKMRLLFRPRKLDRTVLQPSVDRPEACSSLPLETMGAQYDVAAPAGRRRTHSLVCLMWLSISLPAS
jgi:hypothetical protein